MRQFFLATLLLASQVAIGQTCEDLGELLALKFNEKNFYREGECASNVQKLLDLYRQKGGDLASAEVVFVLHEMKQIAGGPMMPVALSPQRKQGGPAPQNYIFHFHMIATSKGRVFDFDFGPQAKPFSEYAAEMFDRPGTPGVLRNIQAIRIPAEEYLRVWSSKYADAVASDPQNLRNYNETARANTVNHFKELVGRQYKVSSLADLQGSIIP